MHDQSFLSLASGTSINRQVNHKVLEPLIYGFKSLHALCMIHTMHSTSSLTPIILCKYDLEAAYMQMHMKALSTIKCMCTVLSFALIYIRLTFGGSFSPAKWCVIIEVITDISNDIVNNPQWSQLSTFVPTPSSTAYLTPITLSTSIPFGLTLPAAIDAHIPRHGHVNSYIDNILWIYLDVGFNSTRKAAAIILAIYLIAHPGLDTQHLISHNYILSPKKWRTKGCQEETKIILGQLVDTR